jgi:hypothetical protein
LLAASSGRPERRNLEAGYPTAPAQAAGLRYTDIEHVKSLVFAAGIPCRSFRFWEQIVNSGKRCAGV